MFVLTDNAPADEEDPAIEFVSGGIRSAVGRAREAARGKNVVVIGADVARQCVQEGLLDEIGILLAPVLLGDCVRFFSWPGAPHAVRLETLDARHGGNWQTCNFVSLNSFDARTFRSVRDAVGWRWFECALELRRAARSHIPPLEAPMRCSPQARNRFASAIRI